MCAPCFPLCGCGYLPSIVIWFFIIVALYLLLTSLFDDIMKWFNGLFGGLFSGLSGITSGITDTVGQVQNLGSVL
jgi:hypothetical protein